MVKRESSNHTHNNNNNNNNNNPHHQSSTSSASRRNTILHHAATKRSSELFSAEALQHVVRPMKKKTRPQHEVVEREDAIGDQMTRLLNDHIDFRFDPVRLEEAAQLAAQDCREEFTFSPLFCHRNWSFVKRLYHRLRQARPSLTLLLSILGFCYENAPRRQTLLGTIGSSVLIFFSLLAAGLSVVVYTSHLALVWSFREACILVVQVALLLFDVKEFENNCPSLLKSVGRKVMSVCKWVDRHLLLEKRYAGREWNKDDFDFLNTMTAKSRHTELWKLPPPCIQDAGPKLCLDQRYMAREEWSQSTSKHVVAINFCYIMMREEHSRKRARRSTVFHQHRSPSMEPAMEHLGDIYDDDDYEANSRSQSPSDEVEPAKHRQVMAMSAKLGEHTEHVFGLASTSPTGGIELVRENQDSEQKLKSVMLEPFEYDGTGDEASDISAAGMLIAETPLHHLKSDSDSCGSSAGSCSSAIVADMNWVDISARIGMRVLNSAHLQRVVASQEAAERIKGITDQFVVSPREAANGRSMTFDFNSPGEMQPSRGTAGIGKPTVDNLRLSLPRSLNRPVHSMWTSAAAAGVVVEEENSASSDDLGWKESKSSEIGDAPSAPPRIVRTRRFPSNAPRKRQQLASKSPLQNFDDSDSTGQERPEQDSLLVTENLGTSELVHEPTSAHVEETYEIVDQGHRNFGTSSAGNDISAGEDAQNRNARNFSSSQRDSHVSERVAYTRDPLAPGVKVAAPLFPLQPGMRRVGHSNYQMATVVSSKRVFVDEDRPTCPTSYSNYKNCLSVTCKIDKSFLRNGEFAELTFRVMDKWGSRYMPKHSKVPIGACVATSYGAGVVVGWRVEDDCHVVRSLWQRRGAGAAHAYLTRDSIHGVLEAAVGFDVMTKCGSGKVLGYTNSGRDFLDGQYTVTLQDDGVYKNCVVSLQRRDVYSCYGAQFIPVIEHIKEACDFQIMLDNYTASLRQQLFSDEEVESEEEKLWKFWSSNLDILWNCFLKAVDEDSEFDEGVDNFMGSIIDFLERLDRPSPPTYDAPSSLGSLDENVYKVDHSFNDDTSTAASSCVGNSISKEEQENDAGFWIVNDFFGGIFANGKKTTEVSGGGNDTEIDDRHPSDNQNNPSDHYKRAFAIIRTLMRTVSLARAASVGEPRFRLALTIFEEFLMFVRTLIKVQQRNVSPESLVVWQTSLEEIKSTFGPIKERLLKIGQGIARRMEQQGRKAKIKVLRFADSILLDEVFLNSLCQGEWKQCLLRIEDSLVKAKIIDEASCGHYRKTVRFIYEHLMLLSSKESSAAERNNEKVARLAKLIQLIASPKRSFLKLLRNDDVLEILERILVRVFCREKGASRMLSIHASNFKSLRHLRQLKDLSVAGRLWIPLLDAADEEFSYTVSKLPENAKEFMCPLSSIFSLCVAQFHKIAAGQSSKDWLDFLLEDDGVRIIHDIDIKLLLALSSFSRDVKDMMVVLPYYPSIDDDILKLMDEVELDKFLKEASEAIDDADMLSDFIREKTGAAIERFLAYLPKLSIPVERRELADGWVLTCHGEHGGDLTLSDVKVKRENLECEIMGGDALFLPIFGDDDGEKSVGGSAASLASLSDCSEGSNRVEESILDHVREMILQARRTGNWTVGIGGVGQPPTDQYVASVLKGLPITTVLNCAIDLWRNLEIDDDELLEIAIRDVSYQIQLHKELEEREQELLDSGEDSESLRLTKSSLSQLQSSLSGSASFEEARNRFNPRVDPTVLHLKIQGLSLHLERFNFRIEKGEKRTVFDPVFEGSGTVSIKNLSIVLRVECARERIGNIGSELEAPILLLRELDVQIGDVRVKLHDTGADWLLNKAVKGFSESITSVVESNLREQIEEQTKSALEQMNSYFLVHPDIFFSLLGITMDDLEEHIVFV